MNYSIKDAIEPAFGGSVEKAVAARYKYVILFIVCFVLIFVVGYIGYELKSSGYAKWAMVAWFATGILAVAVNLLVPAAIAAHVDVQTED